MKEKKREKARLREEQMKLKESVAESAEGSAKVAISGMLKRHSLHFPHRHLYHRIKTRFKRDSI